MSGGGGGGQTTQTIQKADPWGPQQPHLIDIMNQARSLYQGEGPQYFPGQTLAGESRYTPQAREQLANYAFGPGQQLSQETLAAQQFALGDILSPSTNPYLAEAGAATVAPLYENLTRQVLPRIGTNAVLAGGQGGSRQGIAEGLAIQGTQAEAGRSLANLYNTAYGQSLDTFNRALALSPQTYALGQQPALTLDAVGQAQQQRQQQEINDALQRYYFNEYAPWNELVQYQQLVQGNFGGTATGTTTAPGGGSSLGGALGGGLLGYGLATSSLGSAALGGLGLGAVAGPVGFGLGALLSFL